MTALAFIALLTGSCTSAAPDEPDVAARMLSEVDALGDLVDEAVGDPEKRQSAAARVRDLRHETAKFAKYLSGVRERLQVLSSDHDAPRDRLDGLFAEWRARRTAGLQRRAELMVDLKGDLTKAEWSEVTAGMRRLRPDSPDSGK